MPVSEVFYSFQGEGLNLGRRALFVRFRDCNLSCGYSRLPGDAGRAPAGPDDLRYRVHVERLGMIWPPGCGPDAGGDLGRADQARPQPTCAAIAPVDLIVVTGGEPLLRKEALLHLAAQAARTGRRLEIETNATIRPGEDLIAAGVAFNAGLEARVLGSAAQEADQAGCDPHRSRPAAWPAGNSSSAATATLPRSPGSSASSASPRSGSSPEGTTPAEIIAQMRMAAGPALTRGWNLTVREQILIWDGERGRCNRHAPGINVSVIAPAAYLRHFAAQDPPTVHHVAAQRS